MKTTIKHLFFIYIFLISSIIYANNNSKNILVNIAKEQRILSQKVAKSYLLLAYGANLPEIKEELKTSVSIFEKNLALLRTETPYYFSNVANGTIAKETFTWYKLKSYIKNTPNANNLNSIIEISNRLLRRSHLAYISLKTELEFKNSFSVNANLNNLLRISQKQEILSERLCLYFVAQKINITHKKEQQNPRIQGTLRVIIEKIDTQLAMLLKTNVNSLETEKIIKDTQVVFNDIRTNKADFLKSKPSMNKIYKTSKELKQLFKILTSKYTELASI